MLTTDTNSSGSARLEPFLPLRLNAQGTPRQLVDFASRMQELTNQGIVVTDFSITGNEMTGMGLLRVEMTFYIYTGRPAAAK